MGGGWMGNREVVFGTEKILLVVQCNYLVVSSPAWCTLTSCS